MWVWLVDVGHEHTPSLPCPHNFSPVHSYLSFSLLLNVLVCLLFGGLAMDIFTNSIILSIEIPLQAHP